MKLPLCLLLALSFGPTHNHGLLRSRVQQESSSNVAAAVIDDEGADASERVVNVLKPNRGQPERRRTLTVKLVHGLGNQLFQVAALLSIALSRKGQYAVELPGVTHVLGNRSTYWHSVLSRLQPLVSNDSFAANTSNTTADVVCALEQLPHFDPWGGNCSRATTFVQSWSQPLEASDSKCRAFELRGYFQDGAFFAEQLETLRGLFWDKRSVEVAERRLGNLLSNVGDGDAFLVSIHYRLGDYDQNGWVLSRDYYEQAMEKVREHAAKRNVTCLIFSDEPRRAWARSAALEGGLCDQRVLIPPEEKDVTSFYMMALTDASVLADSTFSYFAGVLGRQPWVRPQRRQHQRQQSQRRLVIAPHVEGSKAACFSYLHSWPGSASVNAYGSSPQSSAIPEWMAIPAQTLSSPALLADEAMEMVDVPSDEN